MVGNVSATNAFQVEYTPCDNAKSKTSYYHQVINKIFGVVNTSNVLNTSNDSATKSTFSRNNTTVSPSSYQRETCSDPRIISSRPDPEAVVDAIINDFIFSEKKQVCSDSRIISTRPDLGAVVDKIIKESSLGQIDEIKNYLKKISN